MALAPRGRGADEHDLFPLLDALDPERRLLGITPGGPLQLPPGGAHWYRLGGDPDAGSGTFCADATRRVIPRRPAGADERIVLGGFSQGAVMSWALSSAEADPAGGDRRAVGLHAAGGGLEPRPGGSRATRSRSPTARSTPSSRSSASRGSRVRTRTGAAG